MFIMKLYSVDRKILDSWGELHRHRLISRVRENEKIYNLKVVRSYTFDNVTKFEYENGYYAEIRVA